MRKEQVVGVDGEDPDRLPFREDEELNLPELIRMDGRQALAEVSNHVFVVNETATVSGRDELAHREAQGVLLEMQLQRKGLVG